VVLTYLLHPLTVTVFDVFVCISFMCLRVHVDLIQPLAARNNECCLLRTCDHVARFGFCQLLNN